MFWLKVTSLMNLRYAHGTLVAFHFVVGSPQAECARTKERVRYTHSFKARRVDI